MPLLSHFCGQKRPGRLPRFSVRLVEALCTYAWPMNIRQLKVTAERMVILHGARQEWRRRHLRAVHPGIDQEISAVEPAGVSGDVSAPEAARRALDSASVVQALQSALGNVTEAARQLGVSKQTVYRAIRTEGIDMRRFRERGRTR